MDEPKQNLKLNRSWSDREAFYIYSLVRTDNEGNVLANIANGDYAWATRISEHYNIPVPGEEQSDV